METNKLFELYNEIDINEPTEIKPPIKGDIKASDVESPHYWTLEQLRRLKSKTRLMNDKEKLLYIEAELQKLKNLPRVDFNVNENRVHDFEQLFNRAFTDYKDFLNYYKEQINIQSNYIFFPKDIDLLPEYYKNREALFVTKERERKKSLFNETECKEVFKLKEIEFVESEINNHKGFTIGAELQNKVKLLHDYISWINKQQTETPDQPKTKAKTDTKDEPETRTLIDVFRNKDIYENCLQLLSDKSVKAISDENIFIGNNKGVLIVWYLALEAKGIIPKLPNRKVKATILNNTFREYNVSDALFSAKNSDAIMDYESGFLTDIAAIKNQKR